jgi:AcrR family transcriptional regulator
VTPVEAHERKSAGERREEILDAAIVEFALSGLHGTSTERIAQRVGLSQPYLFRLFGTKKEIFLAAIERCFRQTVELFREASKDVPREEALKAMGNAYIVHMLGDRTRLLAQMHAYAACEDLDVRKAVQRGFGDLYEFAERVSGATDEEVRRFFAFGMLLNVMAAMDVPSMDAGWARRLVAECMQPHAF